MKNINSENLGHAIVQLLQSYIAGNVHTSMPGKVESYDRLTRRGSIKPMLKMKSADGSEIELPVLPDVPFAVYGTANASVVLPSSEGDFVLLVFSERFIGKFMQTGKPSSTPYENMYSLGDAIAFPGIFPSSSSIPATGSSDITIVNNGGKVVLSASGDIELGSGVLTALANELFVTSHVHTSAAPGSPTSTPVPAIPPLSYITSKVKAQ
jgi:hypothetical protein